MTKTAFELALLFFSDFRGLLIKLAFLQILQNAFREDFARKLSNERI